MSDAISSIQSRIAQIDAQITGKSAKASTEDSAAKMQDLLAQLAEVNSKSADSTVAALGLDDASTKTADTSSLLSTLAKAAGAQQADSTSITDNAALKAKAALLYGGQA